MVFTYSSMSLRLARHPDHHFAEVLSGSKVLVGSARIVEVEHAVNYGLELPQADFHRAPKNNPAEAGLISVTPNPVYFGFAAAGTADEW